MICITISLKPFENRHFLTTLYNIQSTILYYKRCTAAHYIGVHYIYILKLMRRG